VKNGILPRCQSYRIMRAAVCRSGSPPFKSLPERRASWVRKSSASAQSLMRYARLCRGKKELWEKLENC
jgi:hypothetical protein